MTQDVRTSRRRSLIADPKPRESRNAVTKAAESIAEVVVWSPTDAQRKAKHRLMIALEDNPAVDLESITEEEASRLAKFSMRNYWSKPGFRDWLVGSNDFRVRAEYLAHKGLDAIEEILDSDDPRLAGAKVTAATKLWEITSKFPNKQSAGDRMADAFIQAMNLKEVNEYIEANKHLIPELTDAEFVDNDDQK